ncbi:MAG: YlmH/Sll1252 family protein [Clostridiales bacterium]|nr:YlmH/Sll1252 family protein [Clostridiales bacterium]
MDGDELVRKRLLDLSAQAQRRDIVTFSGFLNLNEQNIYHTAAREFETRSRLFGGYDGAERQMVAFIPDALCYEWDFPISCLIARPRNEKFAEKLSHRDVLGALMSLGLDRNRLGDILIRDGQFYFFCEEGIAGFITESLSRIRHTDVTVSAVEPSGLPDVHPQLRSQEAQVASNRIDCIIAQAYRLSRAKAAEILSSERVFIDGKCVTDCNKSCANGSIVSVRQKGRFVFETDGTQSKKGKLRVTFKFYE